MRLFLVCSLTRKQLHDIGHLARALALAMAAHGMAHAVAWYAMAGHGLACRGMMCHWQGTV